MATKTAQTIQEQVKVRDDRIIKQLMDKLGTPKNLYKTTITPINSKSYRVNVYLTNDGTDGLSGLKSIVLAHSFFVIDTNNGIVCDPIVNRQYQKTGAM